MAKDPKKNGDYKVGYGKPPKAHQFRPGQSGHPEGREKGTKNLATDLREELAERVVVREGVKARKLTKQRALIKNTVALALKGNSRFTNTTFGLILRLLMSESNAEGDAPLLADEEAVLELLQARAARRKQAAKSASAKSGKSKKAKDENDNE